MTDSKIQAARKLLESGTPAYEVAHSLGVSVPTLSRWVPALHGRKGVAMAGGPKASFKRLNQMWIRALYWSEVVRDGHVQHIAFFH